MSTRAHDRDPKAGSPRRPMRRLLRLAAVGVSVAVAMTLAAACGDAGTTDSGAAPGTPTIRLGLGSSDVTAVYGPVYYAGAQGFWERNSIDVQIQHLSPQAAIPALINGDIDAVFVGKGIISAIADDGSGKVIASLGYNGLELWGNSDITSFDQIRGGTIAATTPGGVVDDAAKNTIADHGFTLGTDISIIYLQSVSASITSLTAGQVQAAVLSPPATVMAESQGLNFLENIEQEAAPGVLVVNGDFLEANRDAITRFVQALRDGYEAAVADKPGIVDALLAASPTLERDLTTASVDRLENSWMVTAYPRDIAQQVLLENPATASVDINSVIDDEFIEASGEFSPGAG